MTSGQASFPTIGPLADFQRRGQSGAWVSDLLPKTRCSSSSSDGTTGRSD
jgi:hypothetical protein